MRKILLMFIISCLFAIKSQAQHYNGNKAIQYAERWWNDFNTTQYHKDTAIKWGGPYVDYSDWGGDCANFVSQCLIFGGLDLSAGSNGNGGHVKPEGVITGTQQLLQHLRDIQKYECEKVEGGHTQPEASFMIPGCPAFLMDPSGSFSNHSIFCVSQINGKNVYNAHSAPTYRKERSYWHYHSVSHYIYISKYLPHCENCKTDADKGELGVDCGGPCPPCEDAPNNRVIKQNNLQTENFALNKISTSGSLAINSGKVTFGAGDEIDFAPGFEIEEGVEFTAQISSSPTYLTRQFRKVCFECDKIHQYVRHSLGGLFGIDVAGITYVSVLIWDRNSKIYEDYSMNIYSDGFIELMNCGGQPAGVTFFYVLYVTTYLGNTIECKGFFHLIN